MQLIDIFLLVLFLFSFIFGFLFGIIKLLFYFIGIVIGAISISYLKAFIPFKGWIQLAIIIFIWIAISFICGIIGSIVQKNAKKAGISFLDRFWGAIISLFFLVFVVIFIISNINVFFPEISIYYENSVIIKLLLNISNKFIENIKI